MVVTFGSCVKKMLDQLTTPGTMVYAISLMLAGGKVKNRYYLFMSATDSNCQSASTSVSEKVFLVG